MVAVRLIKMIGNMNLISFLTVLTFMDIVIAHFKILESPVKQMQRDAISADNFNESKSICDIVGVCEVSVYLLDFINGKKVTKLAPVGIAWYSHKDFKMHKGIIK